MYLINVLMISLLPQIGRNLYYKPWYFPMTTHFADVFAHEEVSLLLHYVYSKTGGAL